MSNSSQLVASVCNLLVAPILFSASAQLKANEADVTGAVVNCKRSSNQRVCNFSATLRHADAGWDHYANQWRVLDPQGNELGVRVLAHPHDNEQPFTRSLGGVKIPLEIDTVVIEARDSRHDTGGKTFELKLP